MNINGNNRFKFNEEKIENAIFYLMTHKEFDDINVKDICIVANINRSSFYSHYQDINDLMIKLEKKFSNEIKDIFFVNNTIDFTGESFVSYFKHMQKHKDFYSAYLSHQDASNNGFSFINEMLPKIPMMYQSVVKNISKAELNYHMTFFGAGLIGITKYWLRSGCNETPEQMSQIIQNEYLGASNIINKQNQK